MIAMGGMQRQRIEWNSTGPLVGRRRAVSVLRNALATARSGEPSIVLLEGGPGVGKSRLLQVARELADFDSVFVGGRFFVDSASPLGPLVESVLPALRDTGILDAPELGGHGTVLRDLCEGQFPARDRWLQSAGDLCGPLYSRRSNGGSREKQSL